MEQEPSPESPIHLKSANVTFQNKAELQEYIKELRQVLESAKDESRQVKANVSKEPNTKAERLLAWLRGEDGQYRLDVTSGYENRAFRLQEILREAEHKLQGFET